MSTLLSLRHPATILALCFCCSPLYSGIIATSGAVQVIPAPPSVRRNIAGLQSSSVISVFREIGAVPFPDNSVMLDIAPSGTYNAGHPPSAGSYPFPQGVLIGTYFVHFNPFAGSAPVTLSGSITVNEVIFGVVCLQNTLFQTDPTGLLPILYPTSTPGRGVEVGSGDVITLSADRRTLSFTLVDGDLDQIRIGVIIPEPASLALIGGGLIALALARRRVR